MIKKEGILLIFAIAGFIFSIFMFLNYSMKITGHATELPTVSNVTISKFLSISMSTNLTGGILFGTVNTIPATDVNATHNFDNGSLTGSTMFMNVSADSNTAVDFCVKSNTHLTDSALDIIGIGNETYRNATLTDPSPATTATLLNTTYVRAGSAIAVGTANYYRFWLDVPTATPAGSYNNSVSFKGVETTTACGT